MTREEIEAEELKIREKKIKAKRTMAWITIICIVAIFAIIFASCSYLLKEAGDALQDSSNSLDTVVTTMTPEEEAEYYNHGIYNEHMAKSAQALKTIGTVAVIAVVICIVIMIIKRKKSRG